jgi:hypothetical protein
MCKWQRVIPRHKGSPRYRIAHGCKDEFGSFKSWNLEILMHFREPGSSLYFIFISYILIFFLFSFFSLYSLFFICSPWTLNYIVPTSSLMLRRLLVLEQSGDRDKVGTRNIFPLERYLKSSILTPSCDLPWIDDPYSMMGCGQGGNHKIWYLVLRVDIQRGLWDLWCGDTQCTDKKASIKIDTQKRNDQLLSLGQRNQGLK